MKQFKCKDKHVFCEECIKKIQPNAGMKKCPLCRGERPYRSYYQSVPCFGRLIKNLKVKCPNHIITKEKAEFLQQRLQSHKNDKSVPPNEQKEHSLQNANISINKSCSDNNWNSHDHIESNKLPSKHIRTQQFSTKTSLKTKHGNRWFRNKNKNRKRKLTNMSDWKSKSKRRKLDDNMATNDNEELCEWVGAYSDLKGHIKQCPLHLVKCKYCNQDLLQQEMDTHSKWCRLWKIDCEQCTESIPRYLLTKHISDDCGYTEIICIQCGILVERRLSGHHLALECPETMSNCSWSEYGCNWREKRKLLAAHEEESLKEHVKLIKRDHTRLSNRNIILEDKCDKLEDRTKKLEEQMGRLLQNSGRADTPVTPDTTPDTPIEERVRSYPSPPPLPALPPGSPRITRVIDLTQNVSLPYSER